MVERLSQTLDKHANGKGIFSVAALYLLIAAGILPRIEKAMKAGSGGTGPIDLRFFYSPDEAYRMIESYGEDGRRNYALVESTVDIVYPLTYATLLSLILTFAYRRVAGPDHPLQQARLLPYGVMLVDFSENAGIVTMLLRYPARYNALARLTSVFTLTKWLGFAVIIVLTLGGLITVGVKKVTASDS
jgi:hypothetical protein